MMKIERWWVLGKGAVFLTVLFLFLSVFGGGRSFAGNPETGNNTRERRVFDEGNLFSGEETKKLEEEIRSMKKEMNMDVVIVTTEDSRKKTAEKYAEDFYIDRGFGVGKDYSGVLFLIDMDNRELYILPVGKMNRFLTDKRWNAILDDAYEAAGRGEYGTCAQSFLTGVTKYFQAGIPGGQYNYDKETGKISVSRSIKWYEAVLALLVGLFAAGITCSGVVRQYSMKKERGWAGNSLMAYRADCRFRYSDQADNLVNKTVTHVFILRNQGRGGGSGGGFSSGGRSTTHTSSGRTMGGGGRKF